MGLVAENADKAQKLREFIDRQSGELNSALIELIFEAGEQLSDLKGIVYQTLNGLRLFNTWRILIGRWERPEDFINEIEQILRNTFGFRKLRAEDSSLADSFLKVCILTQNIFRSQGSLSSLLTVQDFSGERPGCIKRIP